MKRMIFRIQTALSVVAAGLALGTGGIARGQTPTNFTITTPGSQFAFVVSGTNSNPTLNLPAGNTYFFAINTTAGFHPVNVNTNTSPPFTGNNYSNASPQNISSSTIALAIPATGYPSTLYYICGIHGFFGTINVLPPVVPPAPPSNIIISIVIAPTNVTVKSTGTNTTYVLVPQFKSNLVSAPWLDVPVFSNNFANGTNTTTFGRLEPVCGSNVFLRISQRPPQ